MCWNLQTDSTLAWPRNKKDPGTLATLLLRWWPLIVVLRFWLLAVITVPLHESRYTFDRTFTSSKIDLAGHSTLKATHTQALVFLVIDRFFWELLPLLHSTNRDRWAFPIHLDALRATDHIPQTLTLPTTTTTIATFRSLRPFIQLVGWVPASMFVFLAAHLQHQTANRTDERTKLSPSLSCVPLLLLSRVAAV